MLFDPQHSQLFGCNYSVPSSSTVPEQVFRLKNYSYKLDFDIKNKYIFQLNESPEGIHNKMTTLMIFVNLYECGNRKVLNGDGATKRLFNHHNPFVWKFFALHKLYFNFLNERKKKHLKIK